MRSAAEPLAGMPRYLSEPMTSGRVASAARIASMIRSAMASPAVEVESGTSLPIDHMTTAGELRAASTISVASRSHHSSKKRP